MSGADLSFADFSSYEESGDCNCTLTKSILHEATLEGADIGNMTIQGTLITGVDLREVKGLERVRHGGPSTIDLSTLAKSRGAIPSVFLRGCGLSDWEIEMTSMYQDGLQDAHVDDLAYRVANARRGNSPVQFYSCFISYSTEDQVFANRLYTDLQDRGVRCWFAPHDIRGGKKIHEQIDEAIRLHDKLLLILSPHSMNSYWVKTEIANAREREEREQKQVLFPLGLACYEEIRGWKCFDADTGTDSARAIREYFIPDFSNWSNRQEYERALIRLVKDLASRPPL